MMNEDIDNDKDYQIMELKQRISYYEPYKQKYEDLKEDWKYIKSLLDKEFNERTRLKKENEQLRLELETHKHPLWSTREAEKKVNKLADSLADEVNKNGLLNEEINQLRIENMRLKKKGGDEMCKQTCGTCKHFHLDGMFGFWCEKDHDWTLVNGNCSDFER